MTCEVVLDRIWAVAVRPDANRVAAATADSVLNHVASCRSCRVDLVVISWLVRAGPDVTLASDLGETGGLPSPGTSGSSELSPDCPSGWCLLLVESPGRPARLVSDLRPAARMERSAASPVMRVGRSRRREVIVAMTVTCDRSELEGLLAGDEARWLAWKRLLYGMALRRFGLARQDADDVVQDALLKFYGHLARVRESRALKAYALQVLRNEVLQLFRSRARRPPEVPLDGEPAGSRRRPSEVVPSDAANAEEVLAARERRDAVLKAILRIASAASGQKRQMILRLCRGELDRKEIAKQLGVTENTVSIVVSRFRKALRAELEDSAGSPEPPSIDGTPPQATAAEAL